MDKTALEALVRQVLLERLGGGTHGVKAVQVPRIAVTEEHRMDTGNPLDRVYTRDLFTLQERIFTHPFPMADIGAYSHQGRTAFQRFLYHLGTCVNTWTRMVMDRYLHIVLLGEGFDVVQLV